MRVLPICTCFIADFIYQEALYSRFITADFTEEVLSSLPFEFLRILSHIFSASYTSALCLRRFLLKLLKGSFRQNQHIGRKL